MLGIFNTLTGKIETFMPREDGRVKMYTCGPSIYRRPHIGNYRTFLFEDILQRYLEYLGYDVVRLITLTDIEDKAIAETDKEKVSIKELTQGVADIFFSDLKLLRIESPTYAPRSSTTVDQAVELIKILLKTGYAYWYKGNVYFDPLRFKGFGKLSKLDMSRWPRKKRRFHKDNYPRTPWNLGDFILWHGHKEGEKVYWDTDIGRGRPAWNIQDAAMVTKHLGYTIDIACGGIDNLVRHHDYTISIVEGISSGEFARYWLHGGHLFVDGRKMSKSMGNIHYPNDLLSMGYGQEHIRFFLIYGHYRKKLNFTFAELDKARRKLDIFKDMVNDLQKTKSAESRDRIEKLVGDILAKFERNMNDDLNVGATFDDVFDIISKLDSLRRRNRLSPEDARVALANLRKIDQVLRIIF